MTKTQKIWFWIGLGLFIVPEIALAPVGNFWYVVAQNSNNPMLLRANFVTASGFGSGYGFVVLIELLGLATMMVSLIKATSFRSSLLRTLLLMVTIILALITLLAFCVISFVHISFP